MTLGHTIAELESLDPSFVSVTYGAGGSTRDRTHQVVTWIRRDTTITPMAHLTCVGHTRPRSPTSWRPTGKRASRTSWPSAATRPRTPTTSARATTPTPPSCSRIREHRALLRRRRRPPRAAPPLGRPATATVASWPPSWREADFAITQFFFEAEHYLDAGRRAGGAGLRQAGRPRDHAGHQPSPGPAHGRSCRGRPSREWLADRVDAAADDPDEVRADRRRGRPPSCAPTLLDAGAPGLHFYTLNRSTATREIYASLGLAV